MEDLILDHKDDWRMYGLVPYNISDIQKGIQFGHAVQEYNNLIHDGELHLELFDKHDEIKLKDIDNFDDWRIYGKTFIVLNGGTTNSKIIEEIPFGSLNQHLKTLNGMGVITAEFYEPDLGEQLTAIVFLVTKEVFNKKEYPGFEDYVKTLDFTKEYQEFLIKSFYDEDAHLHMPTFEEYLEIYTSWVDSLGGMENVKLREFLSQFSFA